MKKPIIGIASLSTYKQSDSIFDDRYYILNNYIKPIIKNGGIPIGILMSNEKIIRESLDLCDALIIPGGSKIIKAHLEIIDYAIKKDKALLGICMGFQALAIYSIYGIHGVSHEDEVLRKIFNNAHDMPNPKRNYKSKKAHSINIDENSKLYSFLRKNKTLVNSFHQYKIDKLGKNFVINAISDDNIIEGIEYNDPNKFIIGLQFHPELLSDMDLLFKEFIDTGIRCQKKLM